MCSVVRDDPIHYNTIITRLFFGQRMGRKLSAGCSCFRKIAPRRSKDGRGNEFGIYRVAAPASAASQASGAEHKITSRTQRGFLNRGSRRGGCDIDLAAPKIDDPESWRPVDKAADLLDCRRNVRAQGEGASRQ